VENNRTNAAPIPAAATEAEQKTAPESRAADAETRKHAHRLVLAVSRYAFTKSPSLS